MWRTTAFALLLNLLGVVPAIAQTAPSASELAAYEGAHAFAADNNAAAIQAAAKAGDDVNGRDMRGRTPAIVATHRAAHAALGALIAAGADLNLLDHDRYDVLTIAAVANDVESLQMAMDAGANTKATTSIYDGTALIAAAHLGHSQVVALLVAGGAPLDHFNNLGWTALIEAIVLGDGGPRHQATVKALIAGGVDVDLPDGSGRKPLALAEARGFKEIAAMLMAAGAHAQ